MIELKIDAAQWKMLEERVGKAGKNAPKALMRAINHTGKKAKTQMIRALVSQTGLKAKTMRKALKDKSASGAGGSYVIYSKGGNVRLKFFGARETRGGVSAAPWNKRKVFAGTFMRGGRFPKRKDIGMGGAVLRRAGAGRLPLKTVKSGLYIPKEMVSGSSEAAFYSTAQRELAARLAHELGFMIGK